MEMLGIPMPGRAHNGTSTWEILIHTLCMEKQVKFVHMPRCNSRQIGPNIDRVFIS